MEKTNSTRSADKLNPLPQDVISALDVISGFGDQLNKLDDGSKNALVRIIKRYGEILENFYHINTRPLDVTKTQTIRIELLKKIQLFQGISSFDLTVISDKMMEQEIPPNIEIITQNQIPDGVYFIDRGEVEVLVNNELVDHKGAGECFGEISCLQGIPAFGTIRTLTQCKVFKIKRNEFIKTIDRFPQLWKKLYIGVTKRFQKLNQRSSEILHHSPQGLLKINKDGLITDEFSAKCADYLNTSELEGRPFAKMIFNTDPFNMDGWNHIFPLIFEENIAMKLKDVLGLLPKETVFHYSNEKKRHYVLTYYPCYTPDNQLNALDIGIEDVTEERETSLRNEKLQKEKQIINKIYEDPEYFFQILKLIANVLSQLIHLEQMLRKEAQGSHSLSQNIQEEITGVMRSLHTLKGTSSIFNLEELKQVVHEQESLLSLLSSSKKITLARLKQIEKKRELIEEEGIHTHGYFENISHDLRTRLTGMVFSRDEFKQLKSCVHQGNIDEIRKVLYQFEKVSVRHLVQKWPEEIKNLSGQLGKQVSLNIEGDNILISNKIYEQLDQVLPHLMRNCMDHGLETKEERITSGKTERGRITAYFCKQEDDLLLEISDDGRGLDHDKIIEKASENKLINQNQVSELISQNQIWKILFLPGFSTADHVTDLSGRGVGLDALQEKITFLNGTIQVFSEKGEGTKFSCLIPLKR